MSMEGDFEREAYMLQNNFCLASAGFIKTDDGEVAIDSFLKPHPLLKEVGRTYKMEEGGNIIQLKDGEPEYLYNPKKNLRTSYTTGKVESALVEALDGRVYTIDGKGGFSILKLNSNEDLSSIGLIGVLRADTAKNISSKLD